MKKILVLHGPNLNLLGTREPAVYGSTTLNHINSQLIKEAKNAGMELTCFQSNSEADLIHTIQQAATATSVTSFSTQQPLLTPALLCGMLCAG